MFALSLDASMRSIRLMLVDKIRMLEDYSLLFECTTTILAAVSFRYSTPERDSILYLIT